MAAGVMHGRREHLLRELASLDQAILQLDAALA
jgi:hypothetical protein